MTPYSATEIVPKYDPRIARRGALDTLLAEVRLLRAELNIEYSVIHNTTLTKLDGYVALMDLTISECIRLDCGMPLEDSEWSDYFAKFKIQCAEIAKERFLQEPSKLWACKINLLRAHIRETELMFCYEDASKNDQVIQGMLNDIAAMAYVVMWEV